MREREVYGTRERKLGIRDSHVEPGSKRGKRSTGHGKRDLSWDGNRDK